MMPLASCLACSRTSHQYGCDIQLLPYVQADEGFLYPLERAFFYIHKPPMLLPHDEIAGIEFMRQGGGVLAASAKTFDLAIRLASNDQVHRSSKHLVVSVEASGWLAFYLQCRWPMAWLVMIEQVCTSLSSCRCFG